MVKLLIENGAEPNMADYRGYTPLHEASYVNGYAKIAKYLLEVGANVNTRGPSGFTALQASVLADGSSMLQGSPFDHIGSPALEGRKGVY